MLLSHPPRFLHRIYSSLFWTIKDSESSIYITFDDGPTAHITEEVLQLLKNYEAKATFFCLGKNVEENPLLFQSIIEGGHSIGNHSYSHLNGWKTNNSVYLKDVERCSLVFSSKLYRPPYGKINASQIKKIRKKYKIIMWSILSRDYDKRVTKEKCLKLCTYNLKPGSIIVFHDSVKAKENMLYALKGLLEHAKNNKLTCKAID